MPDNQGNVGGAREHCICSIELPPQLCCQRHSRGSQAEVFIFRRDIWATLTAIYLTLGIVPQAATTGVCCSAFPIWLLLPWIKVMTRTLIPLYVNYSGTLDRRDTYNYGQSSRHLYRGSSVIKGTLLKPYMVSSLLQGLWAAGRDRTKKSSSTHFTRSVPLIHLKKSR